MKLATWPAAPGATSRLAATTATRYVWQSGTSTDFDPGMPFGTYTLCLHDDTGRTTTSTGTDGRTTTTRSPSGQSATQEIPPTAANVDDDQAGDCH